MCRLHRYIERPLLVRGRKFDIRLWVLVTHAGPPSKGRGSALCVWGFSDSYLRLSAKPFALNDLADRTVHLCNYSVQKDSSGGDDSGGNSDGGDGSGGGSSNGSGSSEEVEVAENMAAARSFARWCDVAFGEGSWQGLMHSVRALVLAALLAARPSLKRRGVNPSQQTAACVSSLPSPAVFFRIGYACSTHTLPPHLTH
jgi:hypothetical protein